MADAALAELEAFAYSEAAALAAAAEAEDVPAGKRARTGADAAALLAEAERELADSAVEVGESLDANSMKQMVLSIEKRITENSMMRMKYPDAPEKYFDSELGLFQELKRFHVIASAPELYPTFIKTKCLPSLLGLLAHENQDISIDVVDLLHEMCDAEGDPADTLALVELMLEHDAGTLLVQHMSPLKESEPEEEACIHASLRQVSQTRIPPTCHTPDFRRLTPQFSHASHANFRTHHMKCSHASRASVPPYHTPPFLSESNEQCLRVLPRVQAGVERRFGAEE